MIVLGKMQKYVHENSFGKDPAYHRPTQVLGRCPLITQSVQSLTNCGSLYEMAVLLHSSAYISHAIHCTTCFQTEGNAESLNFAISHCNRNAQGKLSWTVEISSAKLASKQWILSGRIFS